MSSNPYMEERVFQALNKSNVGLTLDAIARAAGFQNSKDHVKNCLQSLLKQERIKSKKDPKTEKYQFWVKKPQLV